MVVAERPHAPVRGEVLNVRLSTEEKRRLESFAFTHDLRVSQAIRHILRERLAATESAAQETAARP